MAGGKFDPIEDAKLQKPEKKAPPPPPPAPPAPPPPPVMTGPVITASPRYRVMAGKSISWYGAMTYISEGTIVSAETHGPSGMERLRQAGVELKLL